jgi:glycosyltransferase involved in cell wall biosynthesis
MTSQEVPGGAGPAALEPPGGGPVRVIIPALNEEKAIALVLKAIPAWVAETIVVDNGSSDGTAAVAGSLGATVVTEKHRGYGAACLRGMAALPADTAVTVFLDGDYSDYPEEMARLLEPIAAGRADLVIGSRVLGRRAGRTEAGALMPVAVFGNWLSTRLVKWGWGFAYTDLGPFRAIRHAALKDLGMGDRDFGWTIEMQVKALNRGLRVEEVPVSYRKRIGKSKISGTVLGSYRAGRKILAVIGSEWLRKLRDGGGSRGGP